MIECGEDLSFFAKASEDEVGVHPTLDEFYRGSFVEFIVGARRFVDRAHAASSNLSLNPIRAETASDHGIFVFDKRLERAELSVSVNRVVEQFAGAVVLRQEDFDVTL